MNGLKVAASVIAVIGYQVSVGLQHIGAHICIIIPQLHDAPIRHGLLQHTPLCIIFILYAYDASWGQHAFQLPVLIVSVGVGMAQWVHEFPQLPVAVPQPHLPACVVAHPDQVVFFIVSKGQFSSVCSFDPCHPAFVIAGIGIHVPVPVLPRKEPSFRGKCILLPCSVDIPEAFLCLCEHSLVPHYGDIQTTGKGTVWNLLPVALADGQPSTPFFPDVHLMVMVPALSDAATAIIHGIVKDLKRHPSDSRYDEVFPFVDEVPGVHVDGVTAKDLASQSLSPCPGERLCISVEK